MHLSPHSLSPPASMWELKFQSRASSVVQVAAITVSFLFCPSTLSRIDVNIDYRWGLIPVLVLSRGTLGLELEGQLTFPSVSSLSLLEWMFQRWSDLTVSVTKFNRWLPKVGLMFTTIPVKWLGSYVWGKWCFWFYGDLWLLSWIITEPSFFPVVFRGC